jgi:hypothetical protein
MANPVLAGASFAPGLKTEFLKTYYRMYDGINEEVERYMRRGIPSDKDQETYFFWESAPHMKRWIRGTPMSSKAFRGVKYTASNYEWAQSIDWHFADEQDDQTKSLVDQARGLGQSSALLDERVFFQILTGGSDAELLETVPTAPDGQALFSATSDGSTARFGKTNGNLLTGTGTSESQIRTDFFSVMSQFRGFQDTEGQPLWDRRVLDSPVTILAANTGALMAAFGAVFQQELVHTVVSSTGAAVSNIIKAMGFQVRLCFTQRLTGNSWYAVLEGADVKPVFSQMRQSPAEINADFPNSDDVRHTGYKTLGFYQRQGYGVSTPYAAIKVTNV